MNVLIIALMPPWDKRCWYSHGAGYLISVLKEAGHNADLLRISVNDLKELDSYKKIIEKNNVIALSYSTNQANLATEIFGFLSAFKNKIIIAGGIHPTITPESQIKIKTVNAVFIGESEEALVKYLNYLNGKEKKENLTNILMKEDGEIFKSPGIFKIKDINKLPFADRESFNYAEQINFHNRAEVIVGRGCPFECSYCVNKTLKSVYTDNTPYVRFRSPENVINEIKYLIQKYKGIKLIQFHDDIFILNKNWLKEFSEAYKNEINLPYWCNGRSEYINEGTLKNLKRSNCQKIFMAIESGDYNIRKNVLNRDISDKALINSFLAAKKSGIKTHSHNMIGFPGETLKEIKKTLIMNLKCKTNTFQLSIFYPYPKTSLYERCKEKNMIKNENYESYTENTVLKLSGFKEGEIKYYFDNFNFILNSKYKALAYLFPEFHPKSFIGGLKKELFDKIKKNAENSG